MQIFIRPMPVSLVLSRGLSQIQILSSVLRYQKPPSQYVLRILSVG
jgi:hypothetical protein